MSSRARNIVIVGVVSISMLLIVVLVAGARSDAHDANAATADIAQVLNRRSPVLEYLECSFGRVGDYAAASVALADGRSAGADLVPLQAQVIEALRKLALLSEPIAAGGCGEVPKPQGG